MPLIPSFETARLQVCSWDDDLASGPAQQVFLDELQALLSPAVLQHLPEPLQLEPGKAAVAAWVAARAAESQVLQVRRHSDGKLAGLVILAAMPSADTTAPQDIHLGYLLAEHTWGQGYASELLGGLAAWFRAQGRPVRLLGGVGKENPASAKVLQKNGFSRLAALSDSATDMFVLTL